MRRIVVTLLLTLLLLSAYSQPTRVKPNRYPSLMWEITGNGLTRPSYLFGTMHVSSKMVFHLSDSFYLALKNADVVALETDPGTWQDDFSKYDVEGSMYNYGKRYRGNSAAPEDYLSINTLRAYPYQKLIMQALSSSPSIINSFLYRSSMENSGDFEEDTYLDLYIFQIGKKWNKKVCGVENFDESMRLLTQGYIDAAKDKKTKERTYDPDDQFSYAKMEEAYRTGNLDLLDTINKVNSTSAAFDETFVYRRNDIQAHSIDSILKTRASLFVGVGAAHLPGQRGVIELLRRAGYSLRPINMTERGGNRKDELEKIKVPQQLSRQASEDGFYAVQVPGKLYNFSRSLGLLSQQQYADMINGSYYMVSRVYTNAALWGYTTADVYRQVDSLLYENIPGKILQKQAISKNGYNGFDIINRTRRGDYQHYQVFVAPFEVIIFKVSGIGEYIRDSKEAEQFFSSVQLKEYRSAWKKYSPAFGGFEAEMPHQPVINNASNWQFMSYDEPSGTTFEVIRTDIYNNKFVEVDSVDLNLMEESFASSEFIDHRTSRKYTKVQGYAALDVGYTYSDGSVAKVRYIIQGPHYYTLVARAPKANVRMDQFIHSFAFKEFYYTQPVAQTDSVLLYKVSSVVPVKKKKKLRVYPEEPIGLSSADSEDVDDNGYFKDKLLRSDSTGEAIYVSFFKPSRYYLETDIGSSANDAAHFKTKEQEWVYRFKKEQVLPDSMKVLEYKLGDPGSSRMLWAKTFSKDGVVFHIETLTDTVSRPSTFIRTFFDTFTPVDTVRGANPFEKKTPLFFADFFSMDSLSHDRAVRNVAAVTFDASDVTQLKRAVQALGWREKKYMDVKKTFLAKFAAIPTREVSDYLKDTYLAAGDTLDLQYAALDALLQQKTGYAFTVFRDIMMTEPPVLELSNTGTSIYEDYDHYNNFLDHLTDSLQLTRSIIKDLLPMINLTDYRQPVLNLLHELVDCDLITAKDYAAHLPKFLLEARQLLKRQMINEKSQAIMQVQKDGEESDDQEDYSTISHDKGVGNHKLIEYATVLMPFWNRNAAVPELLNGVLSCGDKRLKYDATMLMLRHARPYPDTMLTYFASLDEYRYELYTDLAAYNQLTLFPAKYLNQPDLARSELKNNRTYSSPDSFVYVDKLPLQFKGRTGVVHFFKYKQKKDDVEWKLATVGLLPANNKLYRTRLDKNESETDYDFTQMSDVKLSEEEPLNLQLQKALKRQVYARQKSAARFYQDEDNPFSTFAVIKD